MKIKRVGNHTIITLDEPTKEININTPCIINTVNQDSLNRVYINISKE